MRSFLWLMAMITLLPLTDGPARADDQVAYRTDTANPQLPWYRLKSGESPPLGSEHRVIGELVEADYVHRIGQFRSIDQGFLVEFSLLPYATVMTLNAEGDLRDLPLGTLCSFSLYQDARGNFTQVASIRDEFSRVASEGLIIRLDAVNLSTGQLDVSNRRRSGEVVEPAPGQLFTTEKTRVWKGSGPAKLSDLVAGDELLVNHERSTPDRPLRCTQIWAGDESQKLATERQRKRHENFLRERGLAARIDSVDGKKLTVSLFGDPASLQALFKRDGIDPQRWATEHRFVDTVVANEELRTYNPPVDRKRAKILEFQAIPTESHGCAGVRWVIEPELLLEGFRKGRIVRLFAHQSWPVNDMPFGESLYVEHPDFQPPDLESHFFPYRTDFANEHLAWYRLKPGKLPPWHSAHRVVGELLSLDVNHRSGRFRSDRSGEVVAFTMPPFGSVRYLNAEADLGDLTIGNSYHLFLNQDDRGSFSKATVITDDFTRIATERLSYRLDAVDLEANRLCLSWRHAPIRNEKEALIQPPDLGTGEFAVDGSTRFWKKDKLIALRELVVGEELLVNLRGRSATSRGICTDIWVDRETHALAMQTQFARHDALLRENGLPAWIEKVEGLSLIISFFAGDPKHFPKVLADGVKGDGLRILLADEELHPTGPVLSKPRFIYQFPADSPDGTYGSSGVRWRIEADKPAEPYRPGQILRVFREGWPTR